MSGDVVDDVGSANLAPAHENGQDSSSADPSAMQYAGFARRLAAFVIDFVVFTFLQIAIGIPSFLLIEWFAGGSESTIDKALMIICILVMWLYYAFLESSALQATFGKKLLGIQVVDLYGYQIGFWRATVRHFAKLISSLFFFFGFMVIDFTKHKQGMHDMMARTLVIMKPNIVMTNSGEERGHFGS